MNKTKAHYFIKYVFIFSVLTFVFVSNDSWSYNKSWDQGHKCVNPSGGKYGWGRWDYDGKFQKGKYSSKLCCQMFCKICPVYATTGQYQKTFNDLIVPGIGPALVIKRTYNSQDLSSGIFGNGWSFKFGKKIVVTRSKSGEKRIGVILDTGEKNYYRENIDGSLTRLTEYGAEYELLKNADNTYTMIWDNGTWCEIREDGKVSRIIDSNQKELVFEYNSVGCLSRITNASGNYVDFQLGANGKVASVKDNLGRTVSYGYDENGNLTSFTDPMGNTMQYAYNSDNYLTQIVDARGYMIEMATYDNNQPPRVSTFIENGESYTISYFDGMTEKTDSNGNKWTYYFNENGVIERVVNPDGNEESRQYNKITSTSLDWEEDKNGNRTTYFYNQDGNITSVQDAMGNVMQYTYEPGTDNISTETDKLGRITKYEYDSQGNTVKIYNAYGTSEQTEIGFENDSAGNIISKTDEMGNKWMYTYDSLGNRISETDPLGNTRSYTYDNLGNLLTEIDEIGNTTTYQYDLLGRKTKEIDPAGNETTYSYDSVGNLLKQMMPDGSVWGFQYDMFDNMIVSTDPLGNTTERTYDHDGKVLSETDPNGKVTYHEYDFSGNLVKTIQKINDTALNEDADDIVWRYGYNDMGKGTSITDPLGNVTSFAYDALGRMISKTLPDGTQMNYTRDAVGNVLTESLPNGNTISYTYDLHNRVVALSDNLGKLSTISYDNLGRVVYRTDGNGNTISYKYDSIGKLLETTDAMDEKTNYAYDMVGNLLAFTDREGNTTQYGYDMLGRRIAENDPLGNQTTMQYDLNGNLLSVTDANGNVTSFEYDSMGRLVKEISADGASARFAYDAGGNLISKTDRDGNVIQYVYDDAYRMLKIDYPGDNDTAYTYNKLGMSLSGTNNAASISMTYDSVGRLTQYAQNGRSISYSYDIPNGITLETRPNGRIINLSTDLRGRLSNVADGSLGNLMTYSFNNGNQLLSRTYGNGVETTYSYNANSYITGMIDSKNSSMLSGFQYNLDKEGHRTIAKNLLDNSLSEAYLYDDKYRLTDFSKGAVSGDHIPSPSYNSSWQLDPVSNWVQMTTDGSSTSFTSNVVNEYNQVDGTNFVYDNRGNLLDDGMYIYSYNYENRLVEIKDKATDQIIAQYNYGPFGRRINKLMDSSTCEYLYSKGSVIEEYNNAILEKEYVHGIGTTDKVIFSGGNIFYCLGNSLGSIIGVIDDSGDFIETYQYSAYGEPAIFNAGGTPISDSLIGNTFLFVGMRFDSESGLYHTQYRQYDSWIGRFLGRDPLRSTNLYEYAGSNPINYIDPLGLKWVKVPGKSNIYMADSDAESLKTLAKQAGGTKNDWVCLWPHEEMNDSSLYKQGLVEKCDTFDVSNLTYGMAEGGVVEGIMSNTTDGITPTYQRLLPLAANYAGNASGLAQEIKRVSGEGNTPISLLRVAGHSGASGTINNGTPSGKYAFSVDDLLDIAIKTQTYNNAKNRKGPIRCWFTKNAIVRGLGCKTKYYAKNFAVKALRKNSWSWGTTKDVLYSEWEALSNPTEGDFWRYYVGGLK